MRNLSKGEKKLLENLMTDLEFTKARLDEEAALFGGEAVSASVLFGLVEDLNLTERGLDVGMDLDNTSATKGYKISRVELDVYKRQGEVDAQQIIVLLQLLLQ